LLAHHQAQQTQRLQAGQLTKVLLMLPSWI